MCKFRHIESGFFLREEFSYKLKLGEAWTSGIYGAEGYKHTYFPGTLYQINDAAGEINSVASWDVPGH